MRRWLAFLAALLAYAVLHEGAHAAVAAIFDEYASFHVRSFGLEVVFRTPVAARAGAHWALISGGANLLTVLLGYLLMSCRGLLARQRRPWLRGVAYYLTVLCLLLDPLNLSVGPLIYGGDANGIAVGLGVSRCLVQSVALVALLANRELVARHVLPAYGVKVTHPLLKPWLPVSGR